MYLSGTLSKLTTYASPFLLVSFQGHSVRQRASPVYVGTLPPRALLIRPAIAVLGLVSLNV